ncbi:MAG: polysaccharide deacetylase family protein [Kiritimatiellae bacterium]|nr:polysaccharide deacetylase family protein [Kiritimatiellia bacterium]
MNLSLGLSSYEARFRWLAVLWAILMTIWCMCPLPWQTRLTGAAIWIAITILISLVVAWWRPRSKREVPIFLSFNHVAERPVDPEHPEKTIRPQDLETLIFHLKAAGYRTLTTSEAIAHPDLKSVVLTFDGGSRDAFFALFPILRKLNAKATCLIPECEPADVDQLKVLEIKEMARSGLIEFGATVTPQQAQSATLAEDIRRMRHWLTGVLGALPIPFALPDCPETAAVKAAALAEGYQYILTKGKYMRPIAEAPDDIHRRTIPGNRGPLQCYLLATRGRYRIGSTIKQSR